MGPASGPEKIVAADTIYALSSGQPPAAIGVIRISGPQARRVGEQLCGALPEPRRAAVRAVRSPVGELLDEVLLLRFDGPASATGEDLVELHCHGGRAVVRAILAELGAAPGLREAQPGEFTRRAFEHGRIDLTQAEGLADLLEAEIESQRRAALAVTGGAIRRQVESWRSELLLLSAAAEAAIDYAEEDELAGEQTADLAKAALRLGEEVQQWLARPRAEPLRQGIRVVLAGPPNAGKSSLLNRLVGLDRAIVSPEAGTTRDVIEVPVALAGQPFLFIDTAGIRDEASGVERTGVARAEQQLAAADILLWLGSPATPPPHPRVLLVHSRADLPERRCVPPASLAVSTVTDIGMNELVERLIGLAAELLPTDGHVALNVRQAEALATAASSLAMVDPCSPELTAEALRQARAHLDRVTGRTGVEDVLDVLFARFCLGK